MRSRARRRAPRSIRGDDGLPSSLWRDFECAGSTNQPVRQDIQRARRIIAREGFSGLFRALKRGVALPAAVMAPTLAEFLQEEGQGE
jgi:hypothetical protein